MTGRKLHATLHLLDRQIVDHGSGRLLAKVDDVELDLDGEVPIVTGLRTGAEAWGRRLPGLLGRTAIAWSRRLRGPGGSDVFIAMSHVVEIDSAIRVDRLDVVDGALDRWVAQQVIGRIPGARHETE